MFPTINKIFRNTKNNNTITRLEVPLSEKSELENEINISNYEQDTNNNTLQIHGEQDILNLLGYYFSKTHRMNDALGTRANNEQVHNILTYYKDNADNNPVTTFSAQQKAFQPTTQTE